MVARDEQTPDERELAVAQVREPWQVGYTPWEALQYRVLTKVFRNEAAREIKKGLYPHLLCPNTRSSSRSENVRCKTRVNVLARPLSPRTGIRHLDVGNLETIVIVQGKFQDSGDYSKGFTPLLPVRFVLSGRFARSQDVMGSLKINIQARRDEMHHSLEQGEYGLFVHEALSIIDNVFGYIRENFGYIPRR